MFANVLYFLIALVIYTSSDLFNPGKIMGRSDMLNTMLLSVVFVLVCRLSFQRLIRKTAQFDPVNIDHRVSITINRLSILALIFFAVDIYGFKLYALFDSLSFFNKIPTLKAVIFLLLFVFYLIMIWTAAYQVQKNYFAGAISKRSFILSNVSFSLPALLPWFVISIAADLLGLLPFQPLKTILKSPAGEAGYIAVFLVAIAIFGPVFIKKIWNCKTLAPGEARNRIEQVCQKAGMSYSDILLWELFGGAMITAGVMGLVSRFRYVLVTPALLNSVNQDELEAVMMHEIGHVQKHHMLFYLLFFAGFVACNFVFFEPIMILLYTLEPVYRFFESIGIDRATVHPVLFSGILIVIFVLYFRYVFGFFMRNFERQADLHLYRFVPDATPLISTFYKIASFSKQSMEKPSWHHFSIGRRVRFLQRCESSPGLIRAHHLKVKKMMAGYLAVIALVFYIGYSINYGVLKERFGVFIAQKVLLQELAVDPDNADLYVLVGDYYSNSRFKKAIEAYENVLKVAPENIHALNNIAWLLSTCPDESFRDYKAALIYAKKAVTLQRQAYILDTYAEALFANNEFENAVVVAKEALGMAQSKKEYYQEQLERFEKQLAN